MKKRLLSVFLTLCMLLTLLPVTVSASTTTGNFIENPGGEIMTGGDQLTANGWNEDTSPVRGFSYPATDMGVTGYGGTHVMGFYCMGIPSSTASSCYQTFDVTSYTAGSNVSYTFSGLMTVSVQGTGTGTATLKIEQLDTNGNVVSSDSKTAAQPGNALISYTMTGTVVSGATQLRISIAADLNAPYGQNNDAFAAFDDLSLTLTTTPPLTITGGTEGTDYTYTGGVLTVKTATALTIANITPATATTDRVEVTSAAGANLTLAGVNIDVSGTSGAAAFKITSAAGAVNLTLADGSVNTLKSGANCAGLQKDNTSLLTISGGTSGTGALHAVGGSGGAGIGANPDSANGSSMTIAGGSVITESDVAGIGGGSDGAAAFNVVIVGGNVSGTVGGGSACAPIYITVSGGSVNAVRAGEIPTNGSGTAVQLYTLTVKDENGSALADTAVTALTATPALGYAYGLTGVKTDGDGKLYVYLPAGKTAVSVTAGGVNYSGSVTDNAATLTPSHIHCVCGGSVTTGGHAHSANITYLPLPDSYTGGPLEGSYYLTGDTSLANTLYVAAGTTLNLCLSGHTLTAAAAYVANGGQNTYSGVINNQGTLNLCDCTSETSYGQWDSSYSAYTISTAKPASGDCDTLTGGVVTGWSNGDGGSGIANSGTLNFYGGSVAGNQGGGVSSGSDSALTLYGGVIAGNRLTGVPNPDDTSGGGAGIYAQGAAVTMYGGRVSGNTALPDQNNHGGYGGGVYVGHFMTGTSSFTMTGGSITGNRASSTGGGICFDGSSSFTMTGGSITGNSAMAGGGICAYNTLSLSGNVNISGNGADVIGDNLLLFSMEGVEPKVQISAALTNTTPVGLSLLGADEDGNPVYAGGVFTAGTDVANSSYLTNFTSDSADFAVRAAAENQLRLAPISAIEKAGATYGTFTVKSGGIEVTKAAAGDTVTVTPAADSGYAPSGISVRKTGDGSTAVTVTDGAFTMPAYPVTVTVIFKRVSAAPGAPVIGTGANHPTDTAITVSTFAGQEYYISTSADAPASWSGTGYFKAVEAGTHSFTGLTPATKYYIHTRTAETETDMPSESAKTQQYTQPAAPAASCVNIDYANETVSFAGTLEVYTAQTGGSPIISGGSISSCISAAGSSAQTVYVRVKAVSGGAPESEWTAVAIPARPANGAALTVDTAAETVAVPAGYSYIIGSGSSVSVSADTAVTLAPGTMLTCWKTAAVSAFKSAGASVTAPARLAAVDSASFTINAIAEKLPTTAGMQYSADSGTAWTDCTADMALTAFGWDGTAAKSVQVRMKATTGESGNYASDSIAVTIPVRAAAPAAEKSDETISGKHDGAVTGVTALMEYRKSGAAGWTDTTGTAVEDLEPGTYYVRVKAAGSTVCSYEAALTIAAGSKLTLTFDAQGGTAVSAIEDLGWHDTVAPPDTARTGYTFGGWFTGENGAGTLLSASAQIEANTTYYAKWTANTYTVTFRPNFAGSTAQPAAQTHTYGAALTLTANAFVRTGYTFSGWNTAADGSGTAYSDQQSAKNLLAEQNANLDLYAQWTENTRHILAGTVTDDASPAALVSGANVILKQGETTVASTVTDADGKFLFTNLLPGTYNLVAAKGGKTVTMLCAIEKADKTQTYTQNVTLPTAVSNSSTLMVAKDESVKELPKIVVGGLDKLAEAENADIYMTVTQKAADKNNAEQKTILVSADGQSVGMYLDVTLKKGSDALTEADSVLEIVIPYEFSGKNNVNVWRCHNGSAEKFTSLKAMPAAPYADMTFFADTHSGLLYIFAGKFSTYAVSCTYASTGAYGTGSDSAAAYPVDIDTSNIKNGTVTVSPASAAAGTAVILTAKPDAGYKPGKPTVTDGSGKTLALTDNGDGTYSFTMPGGRVSVSAAFLKSGSPFADVPETAYYFDAVLWAAGKGIAQGKTGTLFAPDGICTRAQAVTFLWRAMGSPEPAGKTSPFNDVSAGAYYYEAILWAAEKGIAAGIGGTAFSPDGTVTRAQAMTFLWRAAGKPAAGTPNPFSDVPADAYYRDAVIWAVAQKITGGTGAAAFYPADPCTRAQIVTFLWRCLGK